jgi:hypothetical protein
MSKYVKRVWHRGYAEWAWEVREAGLFSTVFDKGWASSRKKANAAVKRAIEARELRESARWVRA